MWIDWLCVLQGTDFCIYNLLRREHKPNFWKKIPPLPTRLDVVVGAAFITALRCFHFKLSISLRPSSPAGRSKGCLTSPASSCRRAGFNPFQTPKWNILICSLCRLGHISLPGEWTGIGVWFVVGLHSQHTGRGFVKSQSLHRVTITHLPVIPECSEQIKSSRKLGCFSSCFYCWKSFLVFEIFCF